MSIVNHLLIAVDYEQQLALFAKLATVFVVHQLHRLLKPLL